MRGIRRLAIVAALVLAPVGAASAKQHFVRPGQNWQTLESRVTPGDEILLAPGRHRPARFDALRGTAEQPIVIRAMDPRQPPTIEADRYGIRIIRPWHVHIRDVVVVGASINGIALRGGADTLPDGTPVEPLPAGFVKIENVAIYDTGPPRTRGQRHALLLGHLERAEVRGCRFEGWAGSAIEIVGGKDIQVGACSFTGADHYDEINGIRLRAGCTNVRIDACRFENAGDQSISIGAGSRLGDFGPGLLPSAKPGELFEASRVRVSRCVIRGGLCAVAYVNCDRALVRQCTIVRPTRAVVSIRHEQADPRFSPATRCAFGGNLITWEPGDVETITHVGRGARTEGVRAEQNLWWSADLAESLETLGPFPGLEVLPQVTDLDPALDEALQPTVEGATMFGAALVPGPAD